MLFWICGVTAFFSTLSFGFGFGLVIGLVALVMILSSKNKFLEMQDEEKAIYY
jgi:hypothetical protein